MSGLHDQPERYGTVSRALHWGMAALFLLQFASAAARWGLPRDHGLREALWGIHMPLGLTLFLLVLVRGVWGLINLNRRPSHDGVMGQLAKAGHGVLYALMILVPGVRILAAAGGERGLSYLGMTLFAPREVALPWTQLAAEWHGELGWLLLLVILGHIAMAVGWHHMVQRDATLTRMAR